MGLAGGLAITLFVQFAAADEPKLPAQPAEPGAAKAYAVLDGACAGCHQTGKLKTLKQPAGSFGNILDLEAMAQTPSLVTPGLPDASPLYLSIHGRTMPPEGSSEGAAPELAASDLAVIRDWIEQLPPVKGCPDRAPITPDILAAALEMAVVRLGATRAPTTRFVSLAPLHNGCAAAADIDTARAAITQLINSLSLGLDPVKLVPVGAAGMLLEIDLTLIGWSADRWDRLAFRSPAAAFVPINAGLRQSLGTRTPLVDAGWFADAATQAPLYYDLIGMPDTLNALLASLRIDPAADRREAVERIGLKSSPVARGNRLIERRPFANGAAWFSREFAPTAGRPDLFDQTIAAATGAANRPNVQPLPDATLMHFDLPNGFPAYFAANASGARINDVPGSVLKDDAHPGRKFAAAHTCLGCHSVSPAALARGRADDLKARLQTESALSKDVREKLLATHPEPADWQRRLDEDAARFERAMTAAGLETGRKLDGLDPLPALIARYQRAVTAADIADMAGVSSKRILDLGKSGSAALADVTARLAFGSVPRAAVDAVLPEIAQRLGLDVPGGAVPPVAAPAGYAPELVLKPERVVFQSGDLLALTVRANMTCHLTLMTLDAKGRATVLYPNEFDPDAVIEAGRDVRFPAEKSPYQFRLRDKGYETLIGICGASSKTVDGIRHDYEKQRFTELGDYRAFLNRTWPNREGAEPKSTRARAPRRAGETAEQAPPLPAKPEAQARAAIRIRIE